MSLWPENFGELTSYHFKTDDDGKVESIILTTKHGDNIPGVCLKRNFMHSFKYIEDIKGVIKRKIDSLKEEFNETEWAEVKEDIESKIDLLIEIGRGIL